MSVQSLKHNSHLNSAALQHAIKEVLNEPFQSSGGNDYSQVDQRENQTAASPLVIIQYYYSNLLQVPWKYKDVITVQAAGLTCWDSPRHNAHLQTHTSSNPFACQHLNSHLCPRSWPPSPPLPLLPAMGSPKQSPIFSLKPLCSQHNPAQTESCSV